MINITSRGQQTEMFRQRIKRDIARNGIWISLPVPVYKDDGMNGRILVRNDIKKVKGIITSNSNNTKEMLQSDAGRRGPGQYLLTILYDPCLCLEYNTLFVVGNKQYKILHIDNVNNMDIVYQIDLAYTNRHMEGYENNGG